MEESVLANEKRLQEKMHECAQIGGELDRARDEAARALQRANERTETIRKWVMESPSRRCISGLFNLYNFSAVDSWRTNFHL